jgi:hypothetical protein
MSNTAAIVDALALLNAAIATAANADKYRAVVAQAVAEGRDVSDDELAQASTDLGAAIDAAASA